MANLNLQEMKTIAEELNDNWIPVRSDDYLPAADGLYEIFTGEGAFVKAHYIARKGFFVSKDGAEGYDALAWRVIADRM